jgi:hypothetical protein
MGLNEEFDNTRDQVLVTQTMPELSRVLSMMQQIENKRSVQHVFANNVEVYQNAFIANYTSGNRNNFKKKEFDNRKDSDNRKDLKCDYCHRDGHTREYCYKLKGFPEWWKPRDTRMKPSGRGFANMAEGFDEDNASVHQYGGYGGNDQNGDYGGYGQYGGQSGNGQQPVQQQQQAMRANFQQNNSLNDANSLRSLIQQELRQMIKGKGKVEEDQAMINFAHFEDFAGMSTFFALSTLTAEFKDSWIIDSGASMHMCSSVDNLTSYELQKDYIPVFLPDGSIKCVKHIGNAVLDSKLQLTECLHVPGFRYNLLSVNKLAIDEMMVSLFYPHLCCIQDLITRQIVAVGRVEKKQTIILSEANLFTDNKLYLKPGMCKHPESCILESSVAFPICLTHLIVPSGKNTGT